MIQHLPDAGTMLCHKCCKFQRVSDFLYTDYAATKEQLADYTSMGHAWACMGCFLRGHFTKVYLPMTEHCMQRLPNDAFPKDRRQDLTQCIHCKHWKTACHFACYGNWHSNGTDYHPDRLHAFIESRGLLWGCDDCFEHSQLYARWDGTKQVWKS